ncbi:MAG: PAS domain S-box protein [Thermodesulfovibrionales bacterium]|nr:PAS domain S-box protein [Thermodesulfovibrionales bacterium]
MKNILISELSSIKTLLFLAFIYAISLIDFLVFHIIIETYTVVIAFAISIFILNTRQYHTHNFFIILGIAFVYIGIVDLIHMFAYEGMNFKALSGSNRASQLWIFNRYIQALTFLLAVFLIKRRLNLYMITTGFTIIYAMGLSSILLFDIFPDCYIKGTGQTTFKIISEYIVICLFIGSLVLLNRARHHFDEYVLKLIKLSIIFAILQEFMFSLYISVFSPVNATGHVFKVFSFYFMYKASIYLSVTKPFDVFFREINEKRLFLNSIIDSLSYPFYVIDVNTYEVVMANKVSGFDTREKTLCYSLLKKTTHPCLSDEQPCPIDIVKKTKKSVILEHTQGDDGIERTYQIHAYPILNDAKEVIYLIEYWIDITDKKREQEDIKKMSLAIEQSSDSIMITDTQGVIQYVNKSFLNTTGYRKEEVIGEKASILKSGLTPVEVYKDMWHTIKSNRVWRGDLCNKDKAGNLFWEHVCITPLTNDKGEITHFVAVKENIGDKLKVKEFELKLKEKDLKILEMQKELTMLDELLKLHQPSITAISFGHKPLRELSAVVFDELVSEYEGLLEQYVDYQIYKTDIDLRENMRRYIEKLAMFKVGAREILDIHTTALKNKIASSDKKTQAYIEEGRMMVLEMMGYLVNYYRNFSIGGIVDFKKR